LASHPGALDSSPKRGRSPQLGLHVFGTLRRHGSRLAIDQLIAWVLLCLRPGEELRYRHALDGKIIHGRKITSWMRLREAMIPLRPRTRAALLSSADNGQSIRGRREREGRRRRHFPVGLKYLKSGGA
jgi:hypothetical protein